MERRKIADREDARACLAAAEASGVPRARWAREHGVNARRLNAWRVTLERAGGRRAPAAPRRVELVELVARQPAGPRPLELRVGRVRLAVGDGFDEATLARVLRVVLSC